MHDAVVIGGGPIGCYSAYQLARAGFDTLLLEKHDTALRTPVCTGVIGIEAFRKFELPRRAIISELKDFRFIAPSGESISIRPDEPQAYVVDRRLFDGALKDLARSSGVEVRDGLNCETVDIDGDCVRVRTSSNGDVQARAAILASGYNPRLTRSLGLGRISDYFEGAQTEIRIDALDETEIYFGNAIAPSSFAWVVGLRDGRARVGLTARRSARRLLEKFLDTVLDGRVQEREKISWKPIPFGTLERTFGERILAVGEVAGQVKTTSHGGIYYGLLCSGWAVDTLKKAFRENDFGTSMLGEYEKIWQEALQPEIVTGRLLRRIFSQLSDEEIDQLFQAAVSSGVLETAQKKARFDWHRDAIFSFMEHELVTDEFIKKSGSMQAWGRMLAE